MVKSLIKVCLWNLGACPLEYAVSSWLSLFLAFAVSLNMTAISFVLMALKKIAIPTKYREVTVFFVIKLAFLYLSVSKVSWFGFSQ